MCVCACVSVCVCVCVYMCTYVQYVRMYVSVYVYARVSEYELDHTDMYMHKSIHYQKYTTCWEQDVATYHVTIADIIGLFVEEEKEEIKSIWILFFLTEVIIITVNECNRS